MKTSPTDQPLPDRIREALAKRRAAVIPSGLRYAEIDPDLIEALLAENDRLSVLAADCDKLRAVAEAARGLWHHTNVTQPRHEGAWNQDDFIALRNALAALDAAND